jgi:O-antigen/teichoic acid export membrane protein
LALVGQFTPRSLDTHLLGSLSLTVAVGQYNLASNLARAGVDVFISGFSAMLLPHLSRTQAEDGPDRVQGVFTAAPCAYQGFGLLVAGVGPLLPHAVISTPYGKNFAAATPVLPVMAVVGGANLPSGAYSAVLIATDNNRLRLVYLIGRAAISFSSSLSFVLHYSHAGALISFIACGIVGHLYMISLTHFTIGLQFPARQILSQYSVAPGLILSLRALLPYQTSAPFALFAALLYVLAFLFLSLTLGGWRHKDFATLARQSSVLAWVLLHVYRKPLL